MALSSGKTIQVNAGLNSLFDATNSSLSRDITAFSSSACRYYKSFITVFGEVIINIFNNKLKKSEKFAVTEDQKYNIDS